MDQILVGYKTSDFHDDVAIRVTRDVEYEDLIDQFDGPFQGTIFVDSLVKLTNITRFDLSDIKKSVCYVTKEGVVVYNDWQLLSFEQQTQLFRAFVECGIQLFYKSKFII